MRLKIMLVGGLAAAGLVGSGLGVSTASTVAGDVAASSNVKCKPHSDHSAQARVPFGVKAAKDPNTLTQAQVDQLEARTARLLNNRGISPDARANGSVTVPTHVHVLVRDHGGGDVANWQIRRQVEVLNDAFAGRTSPQAANTPFRFRLDSVDRVRNTDWHNMDPKDSKEARRALRIGNARHLNMYITDFAGDFEGLLGFATLPTSYQRHPRLDGTVLWRESLPGGNAIYPDDEEGNEPDGTFNYALGDTGTHEVGHWMNLYHTFQDGCDPQNDYVADTPRQEADVNVFYCNPAYNTCGGARTATDPVQNFMNYVDDECMDRFTRGQRDRMNISWYIRKALSN